MQRDDPARVTGAITRLSRLLDADPRELLALATTADAPLGARSRSSPASRHGLFTLDGLAPVRVTPDDDRCRYRCCVPELIPPATRLHAAWLEAHAEWGPGQHEDGFGLDPSDEVDSPAGFAAWLTRLASQSDPAKTIDVGRHRCIYRWIAESDRVLGGIAPRHGRDDSVQWAGGMGKWHERKPVGVPDDG